MKKREIILDFTSLLDVTLIVIFFFVLFSHLDSEQNKARTEEKINEMEIAIQDAKDKEAIAEEKSEQLDNEIQFVRDYSERQASNVEEMLEFGRSGNIKVLLKMNSPSWTICVIKGEEVISEIASTADIGAKMLAAMKSAKYRSEDTIFCDFVFDGSEPGTYSAYKKINKAIDDVRKEYPYFYYSKTDTSIGKD